MNVFSVNEITNEQKTNRGGTIVYWQTLLTAKLDLICDKHNNKLGFVMIYVSAKDADSHGSVRATIEKLLNGNFLSYQFAMPIKQGECEDCRPRSESAFVCNFTNLEEPLKSLFEELFEGKNWQIQKMLEGAH